MIDYLLHDRVTVVTMAGGNADRYNRSVLTEVRRKTYRAMVVDAASVEKTADRDTTTSDYRVILPTSAAITEVDKVIWNDETYEVIGQPETSRRGPMTHHVQATIRKVRG